MYPIKYKYLGSYLVEASIFLGALIGMFVCAFYSPSLLILSPFLAIGGVLGSVIMATSYDEWRDDPMHDVRKHVKEWDKK